MSRTRTNRRTDREQYRRSNAATARLLTLVRPTTYIGTRLTGHKRATRNGDVNNDVASDHLQTTHQIDWDSATCITYSTDCYQRLTLERWFINIEQTPLNGSQQLPGPYKGLIEGLNQNLARENDWTTDDFTNNKRLLNCDNRRIETHQ